MLRPWWRYGRYTLYLMAKDAGSIFYQHIKCFFVGTDCNRLSFIRMTNVSCPGQRPYDMLLINAERAR